jgi:hypothetical protein
MASLYQLCREHEVMVDMEEDPLCAVLCHSPGCHLQKKTQNA